MAGRADGPPRLTGLTAAGLLPRPARQRRPPTHRQDALTMGSW